MLVFESHFILLTLGIALLLMYEYKENFSALDILNELFSTKKNPELIPPNPVEPQPQSWSKLHKYKKSAVCSDSAVCSEIGRKALKNGGSAVDAAISTLLCNGLITMQSMGLGGGMLMNIYSHSEKSAYSVLGRERAPLGVRPKHFSIFQNSNELAQSSRSIAVPAEVMGYAVAYERFGKLPWTKLIEPTIEICHSGFVFTKHQRDSLESNPIVLSKNPLMRKMFVNPRNGLVYRMGTIVKPPEQLCRTYELLARHGPRYFYYGELASNITKDLEDMGSLIRTEDLSSLKVDITKSKALKLGDYFIHFMPPPSSGYILALVMQILSELYDIPKKSKPMDALSVHRIVEALKFAFVKRWELDGNVGDEYLKNLTCPKYASQIAKQINDDRTFNNPVHYGASSNLLKRNDRGTAHISVLAPNGDAVSVTSSINFYFGCGRSGHRTGILFNNAISDFNIGEFSNYFLLPNLKNTNEARPNRTPMSSMTPIILTDAKGDVNLVIGAAGGTKIISALANILVRIVWLGANVKEAIDAVRFHHQLLPNILEYEYGMEQHMIDDLEAKGHETVRYRERGSAVCGIQRNENGEIFGNADYRKESAVAGF